MPDLKHLKPGDYEDRRASTFNAFVDAALQARIRKIEDGRGDRVINRPTLAGVRASSFINQGEVVGFNAPGILPGNYETNVRWRNLGKGFFQSATLDEASHWGKFGVALEGAEDADMIATAAAGGILAVDLWVPANASWICWADIDDSDKTRLKVDPAGSAQIIWRQDPADPAVGELVPAYVRLAPPQYRVYPGVVVNADIDPETSGQVELYFNNAPTGFILPTVWLDHMHEDLKVSQGKEVLAGYFPCERWRLVGAECEDTKPPMTYQGDYDAGNAPYAAGSVVNSHNFLMHANKSTSQDPEPTPAGAPSFVLPDSPSWTPGTDSGQVYTANLFTITEPAIVLSGYRVYLPTATADYRYTAIFRDYTDPNFPVVIGTQNMDAPASPGWVEIPVEGRVMYKDEVLEIGLYAENTATTVNWLDGDWLYEGTSQNSGPGSGGFNRSNQNTILRIHTIDDNSVDKSTDLGNLIVGDIIRVSGSGAIWDYAITGITDLVTYFEFDVVLQSSIGTLNPLTVYDITVNRSGSVTDYNLLPNHWPANNPSWATVQGRLLTTPGGTPTDDNTAYATDLLQDDWTIPSDWDVVTISSRTP